MNQDLIDNRHIRLFISSTFQDMKDERSYLMTQTFPLLRKLAAERNVTLTELDLRWGITEDEAKNGKVVDICLREVENSIPFFIGIIGNRYGWIPKKEDIWEGTIDRYSQVDEYLKEHLSVTEMEMQFGVLQRKEKMHAYFYIKEEQAENIDYPEMLKRLKEEVIHSDYPSSYYSSKENLSEQIEQAFRDLLDELFPMENTTELEKERIGQRAYKNQLCLSYIKGDQNFKVLDDWLRDANKRQLVITGASGLGKSALLANWINEKLHDKERDYNIIYHFTGNGGSQSSYHYVEKIIRDEIADQYHWTEEGVRTLSLEQLFNKIVAEKQKPLLIVIDAINQLADEDDAKLLNWMPDANKSVKILYSTLEEDKTMGALKRRDYPIFTLQPLDKEQRRQLIEKHLGNFAKRLNKRQVQRIADSNLCENTLVLRSLLDELISFGVYEKLDERINSYLTQDSIEDFYQIYLSHLEEGLNSFESFIQCEPERSYTLDQLDKMFEDFKNGHEDVDDSQWEPFAVNFFSDVVLSILLSKNGLTEDEIFSILTKDKNTPDEFKIKRIELSRILCSLSSHIVMRNGLVTFSHTFISNAIWEKYVKSQKNEQHEADMLIWARRNEIVDFFKSEEFEFSERAYEEIAYQLYKLTELPFEPKWYQNKYDNPALKDLYEFLIAPTVFFHLLKAEPYDLRKYWSTLNYRNLAGDHPIGIFEDYFNDEEGISYDNEKYLCEENDDDRLEFYYEDALSLTTFCRSLLDDVENALTFSGILLKLAEKINKPDYILKAYIERVKIYYNYTKPSEKDIAEIKVYISKIGSDIPQELTIEAYKCLGDLYSVSSATDAAVYYNKALELAKKKFGEESLNFVEIEESIGKILLYRKEYYKAIKKFKKALGIKKRLLGEKSIPVADTYIYMGKLFSTNYWLKAIEIYKELLGDTHIKTIEIKETIANLYIKSARYNNSLYVKAISLYKEIIESLRENDAFIYNSKIARDQELVAHAYFELTKYKEALEYYELSYETKAYFNKEISLESNAQSLFYIGHTQLYLGRIEEGLTNIAKSLRYMEEKYDSGDTNRTDHLERIVSSLSSAVNFHRGNREITERLEQAIKLYQR